MKFPSIKYLTTQAGTAAKRFYLPLLFAFIGSYFALLMVNNSHAPSFVRILFTCSLALPLSLGCMLYAERSEKAIMKLVMPAVAICFSLVYWCWLAPDAFFENYRLMLIYFVLAVVMHLCVAIAAYLRHNERTGFWRFNETLYARMILALVFSGALYIGLSLAITACKILLKFDIDSDVYIRLWIIVAGIFNTWFFLAGIPADYTEVNTESVFPKALKIFTQYILIPIVTLYMVILYVYGFKIIGMWSLPKGWVSMLIFCYSVVGILAVLLVSPLRDDAETPWVRFFSKFFFTASLPLVVLLYAAIYARVNQYGITESRYYLIILGAWLGYVSLYFIFSKQKNIRIVPLSLAIIGVLSLFGPWSVFSVSEKSQLHRLEALLIKNNIWKPGEKVTRSNKAIKSNYESEQLRNIIEYFIDRDDVMALQPIYATNLKGFITHRKKTTDSYSDDWNARNDLKDSLIHILCTNQKNGMTRYRNDLTYAVDQRLGLNTAGYSKMFYVAFPTYPDDKKQWIFLTPTDSALVTLTRQDSSTSLNILHDGKNVEAIGLDAPVNYLKTQEQGDIPQERMTLNGTGAIKPRVIIKSISIRHPESIDNDDKIVKDLGVWILIR